MNKFTRNRYWPYDEVTVSRTSESSTEMMFQSPWMTLKLNINPEYEEKVQAALDVLKGQNMTEESLQMIDWLFAGIAKYPLAYLLPRQEKFGIDKHVVDPQTLKFSKTSPSDLLKDLISSDSIKKHLSDFDKSFHFENWTWDLNAALEFAQCDGGLDPKSIFSVARRYHLLNDIENNQTTELLAKVQSLINHKEQFALASAQVIRQNHYITIQCDRVLRAALPNAQNAANEVLEFIEAESGHDRLLERALKSMDKAADVVGIQSSAYVLMELFFRISQINFLAFAMVVDIFERTSYHEVDPLASLLYKAGADTAADQIAHHRVINDTGEHENAALQFLDDMKPVSPEYAAQALQLGELLTLVIHCLSKESLAEIAKFEKVS